MAQYDETTVNKAIAAQNRSGRGRVDADEARQIHRLLSGRAESEPWPGAPVADSGEGPGGEVAMSRERFTLGLAKLGYNISTAHRLLGMGRSTIYRMADGTSAVPMVVIKLMDMYERFGVPPEHRQ
jgi:transcriptional regulator of acetoin/glycerol metabolism